MPKPISKKKKSEADVAAAAAAEALQKIEEAALRFKALGDPTRLRIVLFLRSAAQVPFDKVGSAQFTAATGETTSAEANQGGEAVTVGAVAFHLTGTDKVSSNISHHIKELRHAGLITMKRRGKNILCRIEQSALEALEGVLCGGNTDEWYQSLAPAHVEEKATVKKRQAEIAE